MAALKSDDINQCGYCFEKNSNILYGTEDIWGNRYTLNQCRHCRAVFLAPRPDAQRLAQAYDHSYYGEKEEKFDTPLIEETLDIFRMSRARRLSAALPENARILDIGCGNGKFLGYMKKLRDYEIHGIELEGNSARRAAAIPGIHLKIGKLNINDYSESTFNAITLFHVFEHLEEPAETLDIIGKILKPGGTLMMSFPNINSIQAGLFKGKWLHLDPPRHLFFFKPNDFIKIMDKRGFDLKRAKYTSFEQNPFGIVQSLLNLILRKREVLFERLKGNKAYAPEYGKFSMFLQLLFTILTGPFFLFMDILVSSIKKGATVEFIFQKRI